MLEGLSWMGLVGGGREEEKFVNESEFELLEGGHIEQPQRYGVTKIWLSIERMMRKANEDG